MANYSEEAFVKASSSISGIVPVIHQNPTYFLAAAIDSGLVSEMNFEAAKRIVAEKRAAEAAKQTKLATQRQAIYDAEHAPERAFPKLFARRNGDYVSLQRWVDKTPTEELKKLLNQLTTETHSWSCYYSSEGKIGDAIEWLRGAIDRKKQVKH